VKTSENGGAFIIKINTDGPAEQAGLRLGEIIKSINGYPIKHAADVCKILGFQVEQKVELLIDRDGKQRTVIVTTL
jgi:S1-C subfamily serine protease